MPNEALVERALAELRKGRANFDYFFDSLRSPNWIRPLAAKEVFADPPPVESPEEGYIRIPAWTASQYLARMAPIAPQEVLEVALSIETNNERIHSDLTEAARAMPGPLAARWADHEIAWLRKQRYLYVLLDTQLAQLITHLADSREVASAFALADELLRIYPPPDDLEGETARLRHHASARVSPWHYHRILDTALPALTRADPLRTLDLLASRLSQALETANDPTRAEDFSSIWRPHVADEARSDTEIEQSLVSGLRDTVLQVLDGGLLNGEDLVHALVRHRWPVIRRVLWHAMAKFVTAIPVNVLAEQLLDYGEFKASLPSPEYRALLARGFEYLAPAQQQEILAWISDGPDLAPYRTQQSRAIDRAPTKEESRAYTLRWRLMRLGLISEHLPDDWSARYQSWVQEVGSQEFPPDTGVSVRWGSVSPYSVDDVNAMPDDTLVATLEQWSPPPDGWDTPTREGLGQVLSELARLEPLRVSRLAPRLRGQFPPYVHQTVNGLAQAIRSDKSVEWPPLLDLASWIVDQPRDLPDRVREDGELDSGWVWSRKEIASLLSAGFEPRAAEIPFDERERAWDLLETLCEDPDPSPAHEERYGGANMDPSTLSLNTIRGQAMHAAIRYGLWVHRNLKASESDAALREEGFARMPELRDVLDAHLDTGREPSVAVRAVYGQWFPWLVLLDPVWAAGRADEIFERDHAGRWAAAWGAYITLNQPYDNVLATIPTQYRLAVSYIGSSHATYRWIGATEGPDERLAHHLMSFYLRGRLDLAPDGLLGDFYRHADDALRASAIEFIGRSLREADSAQEQVRTRLSALWSDRLADARAQPAQSAKELGAFGWWFDATVLDGSWRLAQAETVLQLGIRLDPDFAVFSALVPLASEYPDATARVLKLMLEREKDGWGIDAHRKEIKETLTALLESSDTSAHQIAVDIAHWLGARGYRDFRPLATKATSAERNPDTPGTRDPEG